MTYDSVFGMPSSASSAAPSRRPLVAGIVSVALALLGATLVGIPSTRLIGLGAVVLLAVPVVLAWRRASSRAAFWLTTSALGVLSVAFLAGFVVMLVSGLPPRSVPGTPSAGAPAPVGPAMPADLLPAPVPDAAPPATGLPAPAEARDPAPAKRTAQQTAPSGGSSTGSSAGSSASDGGANREQASDSTSERDQGARDGERAIPGQPARPGGSCEVGSFRANPDGSYLVCGQPDGQGGYTWRQVERDGNGGWGGFGGWGNHGGW